MIFNKTLLYYQSIQSKKLYEDKWYVTRIYGNNKDEQIWKIFLHPEKGILRCRVLLFANTSQTQEIPSYSHIGFLKNVACKWSFVTWIVGLSSWVCTGTDPYPKGCWQSCNTGSDVIETAVFLFTSQTCSSFRVFFPVVLNRVNGSWNVLFVIFASVRMDVEEHFFFKSLAFNEFKWIKDDVGSFLIPTFLYLKWRKSLNRLYVFAKYAKYIFVIISKFIFTNYNWPITTDGLLIVYDQ